MIDNSEILPPTLKSEGALLRASCQTASTKTHSCTQALLWFTYLKRGTHSSALMFQRAADVRCFVWSSAQTPNIEGDSLPPNSYLLVLVSLCSVELSVSLPLLKLP